MPSDRIVQLSEETTHDNTIHTDGLNTESNSAELPSGIVHQAQNCAQLKYNIFQQWSLCLRTSHTPRHK